MNKLPEIFIIPKCVRIKMIFFSLPWEHELVWVVFQLSSSLNYTLFIYILYRFFCCWDVQLVVRILAEWVKIQSVCKHGLLQFETKTWWKSVTEVWNNFFLHVCHYLPCNSSAYYTCTLKQYFLKEKLSVCTKLTPFYLMVCQDVCSSCVWESSTCSGQTCPL